VITRNDVAQFLAVRAQVRGDMGYEFGGYINRSIKKEEKGRSRGPLFSVAQ
jgi:hypothetical protein